MPLAVPGYSGIWSAYRTRTGEFTSSAYYIYHSCAPKNTLQHHIHYYKKEPVYTTFNMPTSRNSKKTCKRASKTSSTASNGQTNIPANPVGFPPISLCLFFSTQPPLLLLQPTPHHGVVSLMALSNHLKGFRHIKRSQLRSLAIDRCSCGQIWQDPGCVECGYAIEGDSNSARYSQQRLYRQM